MPEEIPNQGEVQFTQDAPKHDPDQWSPGDLPEGTHLELTEAPLGAGAPDGSVAINVPVNVIMDQVHMHWAQQMAGQIQRNAELAAALTVTQEALQETQAKLAALTEVTNAPADQQ